MHNVFCQDPYGWLSCEELCKFPLLKSLGVSPEELLYVLSRRSDFFVVDNHQRRIRRDFDRYPNEEIEDQLQRRSSDPPEVPSVYERRSIYIENLPLNFGHENVKNELLAQYPRLCVKYVSLPRHPMTGESLGCAIVELGTEEEAAMLCKKLRRIETEKFDPVSGKLGRDIRVLSFPKYKALKKIHMKHKSLAPVNRLTHSREYVDRESREREDIPDSDSSSESSILVDSDVNSLAQDSVEIRRARNASSIRSNSIIHLSGIPPTTSLNVRIWLSHSAAVQFLDHKENAPEAYARFASRRERDFFVSDFNMSQLPLMGVIPKVRVLNEDECLDYFDNERERRRAQCLLMGPPDSWECSKPKRQKTEDSRARTVLKVVGEVKTTSSAAFTDTVAGNPREGEPGTSMLHGIKKGRHIARKFFIENTRSNPTYEPTEEPNRKKTRRGTRGGKRIFKSRSQD
jgi:hypothetical protein